MAPPASTEWWILGLTRGPTDQSGSAPQETELFHGTRAQAEAKVSLLINGTLTGPFNTRAAAENAIKQGKVNKPDPKSLGQQIPNPLHGIEAVGNLAYILSQPHTWARVAEAVAGGIVLVVALKALFPGAIKTVNSTVKDAAILGAV